MPREPAWPGQEKINKSFSVEMRTEMLEVEVKQPARQIVDSGHSDE